MYIRQYDEIFTGPWLVCDTIHNYECEYEYCYSMNPIALAYSNHFYFSCLNNFKGMLFVTEQLVLHVLLIWLERH